jgi:hypothetical protein
MISEAEAMLKRIAILVLITIVGALCLDVGERYAIPGVHGFISAAQAVVGRPLTPVSVAGVARRTARRCAAGVYC